jgi:predicted nuclease of predicted toxin-antitoxin system
MLLFAVPIELPPHVVEVRSGDIDSDGIEELVAIERKAQGTQPETMALTIYELDQQGRTQEQ